MKKKLLTGFEAFAGNDSNPTQDLMAELHELGHQTLVLPVSFQKSWDGLLGIIKKEKPKWVISCGVAAKRETIDLERVAINFMDASIADNDGVLVQEEKISPHTPASYLSSLPLNDWQKSLSHNFPVKVSLSAGSYVCNYLYYQLMHHRNQYQYQCIFIHFPYPQGNLSLDLYVRFMEQLLNKVDSFNSE